MKLLVLDGNSIVNRAYYGIRMLTAPDGTPTNGIYGFLAILQKLLAEQQPDALCVTFDRREPTFRHERYALYKAQRKGMPEELAAQMPVLKEVLDEMGVRRYELAGWEADDLIGAIARRCEASGVDCRIVTGDRDSFQLITDRTHVLHVRTRAGQTETTEYDPALFREEYGFEPPRMVDLKALMGDSSDNIPGVPGCGEKTALRLLQRFGTLEGVYGNLDSAEIKPAMRQKLTDGRESACLSYELATIRCDAPLDFAPSDAKWNRDFRPGLYALLLRLGFTKFLERWGVKPPEDAAAPAAAAEPVSFSVLPDEKAAADALELAAARDALLAVRGTPDGSCFAFHLQAPDGQDRAWILDRTCFTGDWNAALCALLDDRVPKLGHEVKELQRRMLDDGLPMPRRWVFDTALAAYLLDATAGGYALRRLSVQYLGCELPAAPEAGEQLSLLDDGGEARQAGYAALAAEAAAIAALHAPLRDAIAALDMETLLHEIELPLCPVLAQMEHTGFLVDREALLAFGEALSGEIDGLQREIWALADEEFNIQSPKQLGTILFEKLLLPAGKKTKTGWSTNADVLEKLIGKHPIAGKVLDYRTLTKLKSTYAEGLAKVIEPDGRIHTSFMMTVTDTGRLSSREPNLQNIPVRTPLGAELRRMFISSPGCVLVDADYSQIELRLLAHISGDETMREAFLQGEDIHAVTASQVFGVPLGEVTPLMRSRAKAVNFGIVYGISAFSLAQDIGVLQSEARAYIDAYLERYHGVRDYMKRVAEQAKADGFVQTLYGRRRALPELKSSSFNLRSFGERVARNMPIQGTAADIMKLAMIRAQRALEASGLEARLLLQVHDELIAECREEDAAAVGAILTEAMEGAVSLSVPLTAEAHSGRSWYAAK